mgnify:CR=1 FL=1
MATRKQHSPSAQRNTAPILSVLTPRLPAEGHVLEIASGSGEHVISFAQAFPQLTWTPSDPDADALASIKAWIAESGTENIRSPLALDVMAPDWASHAPKTVDAIFAINLIHISPWAAAEGLMRGAGQLLREGGFLFLYGPYRRDGRQTSESNERFEEWLKGLSPEYGVRDLADIASEGEKNGLTLAETIDMPANNFSLILRKTAQVN